ncbi:hypothetical protein pEaSNUABM46_00205 [Erwinia phage pEa_SNUABM_46]|nr:hypothetical protein pEaSNUABM45_00205 [Erwinia phage pEa_SNUABM_45]QYW04189.1 hypothetical protein pEaSNUABM46_00205 [Erwinia phage pEa_SNUABM_46]
MIDREPIQVPVWRIVKPEHLANRDESIAYHVIAESADPYTDDEIEIFEQTHGKGLIQEEAFEYI